MSNPAPAPFPPLNLPAYDVKLQQASGRHWIWDNIRKKFVVLTPEEWVRQHFIHFMIHDLHYPRALITIERGLLYNRLQKRSDILVHQRDGRPWMLVECKSPAIKLTQRAFNQVAVYNMTVGADFLTVTNGMVHYCSPAAVPGQESPFLEAFPSFPAQPDEE